MNLGVIILDRKLRELTVALTFLFFVACGVVTAAEGHSNLDLRKGLVGPISVADMPDQFKAKLGASNVKRYTGRSEGEEYHGYKLKFPNGQIIDANQSYLEIDSVGFRTPEGLGVGSTWKQFQQAYSDGELMWADDAGAIWSEKYKFRLYFKENKPPDPNDRVTVIHMGRGGVEPW